MHAFFYDTWAFTALLNKSDAAHPVASDLDRELEQLGYAAVTSDYVIDETVTLLQSGAGSRAAVAFLDLIAAREAGRDLLVVEVSTLRRDGAARVFRKLAVEEPRLSFTDASSFAIMIELGIELAFTADRHFHRAGHGIRPLVARRSRSFQVSSLA